MIVIKPHQILLILFIFISSPLFVKRKKMTYHKWKNNLEYENIYKFFIECSFILSNRQTELKNPVGI